MRLFESVEVEACVYPTEDVERVKKAITNLIPDIEFETREGKDCTVLVGRTDSMKALSRLYELFRGQAILDTARSFLEEGYFGGEIIIRLNKQAAYAGLVNFNEESPLGPITVVIRTEDPKGLMKWLAPRTKDGVPVE